MTNCAVRLEKGLQTPIGQHARVELDARCFRERRWIAKVGTAAHAQRTDTQEQTDQEPNTCFPDAIQELDVGGSLQAFRIRIECMAGSIGVGRRNGRAPGPNEAIFIFEPSRPKPSAGNLALTSLYRGVALGLRPIRQALHSRSTS